MGNIKEENNNEYTEEREIDEREEMWGTWRRGPPSSYSSVTEADVVLISVRTPSTSSREEEEEEEKDVEETDADIFFRFRDAKPTNAQNRMLRHQSGTMSQW